MKPSTALQQVVVSGAFDDLRSGGIRFLEEAAKLGRLTVLLWPDAAVREINGRPPKFPEQERLYLLRAIRYVSEGRLVEGPALPDALPEASGLRPDVWVVPDSCANSAKERFCREHGLGYHVLGGERLAGFPDPGPAPSPPGRKKVVVTGCYDWFHSGHVRFFEEVSAHGDVYVIVGHDANIRLLKGEGHPLFPEAERRYVAGSVRYVKQALISSGEGWLDADPEIQALKPDIYAVNEDGDRGGKREYCAARGLEYLVLKRTPAPGLEKRSSTDLRGF
jgi:cytidyltransferase-like protein